MVGGGGGISLVYGIVGPEYLPLSSPLSSLRNEFYIVQDAGLRRIRKLATCGEI